MDLTDLSVGAIDANEFFAENHVTEGMRVLKAFFDTATYRNRVGFLTGSQGFDAVLDTAKKLNAIDQIITELHEDQARDNHRLAVASPGRARREQAPRVNERFLA